MPQDNRASVRLLFWIAIIALVAQLPSGYLFFRVAEIQDAIAHHSDIVASGVAESVDIEFIDRIKKESGFNQDVQILVGPYKKLFGSNFKYRLEQHLVFVEQSQATKETFLILFDKTFYNELSHEKRKGVLAHEMWHIFTLANRRLIKPRVEEEKDADNYATRHVSINTMLELCNYEGDKFMKKIRIENLERQKLSFRPTIAG